MCILQRFYMNSKMKHHKKNINLVTFFKVYEEISKEFNISAHKQRGKSELNGCLSIQRFIMLFGE